MNLLTMKAISVGRGIAVQAYDYTEAQSGNGICDRKIASMKQRIRRYVNEKHNVVTAEDDKKVVEFHGGVMGCRIAVAEVDTEAVDDMERKWAGISFLTNLQFEADGVRSRRSYGIGKGKLEKYS